MPEKETMRKLLELREEIDEVNYFLREWQFIKSHKNVPRAILEEPELRFIARMIERLVDATQELDLSLALKSKPSDHSGIELTQYMKLTNKRGEKISYVGNRHGLLSLSKVAEMVSRGGELTLPKVTLDDWGA